MLLPPVPTFDPIASPETIVETSNVRFTVLTSRLIRLEYSKDGTFEDRPSQPIWFRRQLVPSFSKSVSGSLVEIETDDLLLRYRPTRFRFYPLDAVHHAEAERNDLALRRIPTARAGNLKGTARTLDGHRTTRLEDGLLGRAGWAVVDDSPPGVQSLRLARAARRASRRTCISLATAAYSPTACATSPAGRAHPDDPALHPRQLVEPLLGVHPGRTAGPDGGLPAARGAALGLHRGHGLAHHQDRQRLRRLDRLHLEPRALPRPARLHPLAARTGAEDRPQPAPGRGRPSRTRSSMPRWRAGWASTRPAQEPIPFDVTDPHFMEGYFEILHHPQEAHGRRLLVDRLAAGRARARVPGLDPLWWLNHLHFHDLGRDGRKRPFVFSRWGGLGNHRYPDRLLRRHRCHAGRSLAFQPYFTATAANVGYGWWSHDIGGHMFRDGTPELYLRWVQFGVFSPILRLHSTKKASARPPSVGQARALFQAAARGHAASACLHPLPLHHGLARPPDGDLPGDADVLREHGQDGSLRSQGPVFLRLPSCSPPHP